MSINTPVKRKHKPYDILQNERNISTSPVKTAETAKKYRRNDRRYFLVEVTGLEPTTSWSLTKRATKLRYTSISQKQHILLYQLFIVCQAIFPPVLKIFVELKFNLANADSASPHLSAQADNPQRHRKNRKGQ